MKKEKIVFLEITAATSNKQAEERIGKRKIIIIGFPKYIHVVARVKTK